MKILFVTDLYPVKSDERATPRTLQNFVTDWKNEGYEVDVIKPNFLLNSFLRGKPFYKNGYYDGVLNLNYWTPFLGVKRSEKYDVAVAHMPSGILFADKLNLPMVCSVHSSDIEVLTNPLYFLFKSRMERAYRNARAIACRSYVLREKFLKIFPTFSDKTFVAPSGTDAEIINRDLDLSGEVKVVTCANLIKRKNVDKLIHAMKDLKSFSLTVIGDGKMRKKWEKIDENVRFLGQLNHEDVLKEMKNSHIFVLPSEGETFGMVYLEAMACGCITVCTKNDGVDGIIKDGENGFLTEPKIQNIKETLIKIKKMNDEQIKKISYNCHTTISEYSSKRCSHDYLQQILKII